MNLYLLIKSREKPLCFLQNLLKKGQISASCCFSLSLISSYYYYPLIKNASTSHIKEASLWASYYNVKALNTKNLYMYTALTIEDNESGHWTENYSISKLFYILSTTTSSTFCFMQPTAQKHRTIKLIIKYDDKLVVNLPAYLRSLSHGWWDTCQHFLLLSVYSSHVFLLIFLWSSPVHFLFL